MPVRIECPSCGNVQEADDAFVNRRVRCGHCRAVFTAKAVEPPESASPTHEEQPARSDTDRRQWWLAQGGTSAGPYDEVHIVAGIDNGTISPTAGPCRKPWPENPVA